MLKIKEVDFNGLKSVELSNGIVKAIVTVEVGPRILFFGFVNGKNHMVVHSGDENKKNVDTFVPYGGHRLWTSPEDIVRTYEADTYPIEYRVIGDNEKAVVEFTSVVDKKTGLQKRIQIGLADSSLNLTQQVQNLGLWDIEFACWGLSQMENGGLMVAPQNRDKTELLSNRNIVLWDYTDLKDSRLFIGNRYVTIRGDSAAKASCKIGMYNTSGFAAYFNHGELFIKKIAREDSAAYPDYQCNFESYTCAKFTEVECLSPLKMVKRGEMHTLIETWDLYSNCQMPKANDEDAMEKIFIEKGYIE